jgi:hypothetical protein
LTERGGVPAFRELMMAICGPGAFQNCLITERIADGGTW